MDTIICRIEEIEGDFILNSSYGKTRAEESPWDQESLVVARVCGVLGESYLFTSHWSNLELSCTIVSFMYGTLYTSVLCMYIRTCIMPEGLSAYAFSFFSFFFFFFFF